MRSEYKLGIFLAAAALVACQPVDAVATPGSNESYRQDSPDHTMPSAGYPQYENFCVRADDPSIMPELKEIGVGRVRIWGPWEQLNDSQSQFRQAIMAAFENDLFPIVVFSPNVSLEKEVIRETIWTVLDATSGENELTFEIGNEPDHPPGQNFWRSDIDYLNPGRLGTF